MIALFVAGLLVLVAACGGDDGDVATEDDGGSEAPTAGDSEEEPEKPDEEDVVRTYFEALATSRVDSMQPMHESAEPGSLAGAYAIEQIGLAQAIRDAGQEDQIPADTVNFDNDTVQVCQSTSEDCGEFTDFTVDSSSGKLTNFTIDGERLDGRIIVGNGQPIPALSGNVTLVAAYQAVQGTLIVVLDVAAGGEALSVSTYSASYVGPDGRQSQVDQAVSASGDLQPGAKRTDALLFPGAALGGRVVLPVNSADFMQSADVEIPLA